MGTGKSRLFPLTEANLRRAPKKCVIVSGLHEICLTVMSGFTWNRFVPLESKTEYKLGFVPGSEIPATYTWNQPSSISKEEKKTSSRGRVRDTCSSFWNNRLRENTFDAIFCSKEQEHVSILNRTERESAQGCGADTEGWKTDFWNKMRFSTRKCVLIVGVLG